LLPKLLLLLSTNQADSVIEEGGTVSAGHLTLGAAISCRGPGAGGDGGGSAGHRLGDAQGVKVRTG